MVAPLPGRAAGDLLAVVHGDGPGRTPAAERRAQGRASRPPSCTPSADPFRLRDRRRGADRPRAWRGALRGRRLGADLGADAAAGASTSTRSSSGRRSPRPCSCCPHPDLAVSGTVTMPGRTLELDGARGGQAHLWGSKHALRWAWVHCNDFATEDGRAAPGRLHRRRLGLRAALRPRGRAQHADRRALRRAATSPRPGPCASCATRATSRSPPGSSRRSTATGASSARSTPAATTSSASPTTTPTATTRTATTARWHRSASSSTSATSDYRGWRQTDALVGARPRALRVRPARARGGARAARQVTLAAPFRAAGEHIAVDLPGAGVLFTTRRGGVSRGPVREPQPRRADRRRARRRARRTSAGSPTAGRHPARALRPRDCRCHGGRPCAACAEPPERRRAARARRRPGDERRRRGRPVARRRLPAGRARRRRARWRCCTAAGAGWRRDRRRGRARAARARRGRAAAPPRSAPAPARCCYEVGEEVHAALRGARRGVRDGPQPRPQGRRAARARGGRASTRCTTSGCARCCGDAALFFSHRRDGGVDRPPGGGRVAELITGLDRRARAREPRARRAARSPRGRATRGSRPRTRSRSWPPSKYVAAGGAGRARRGRHHARRREPRAGPRGQGDRARGARFTWDFIGHLQSRKVRRSCRTCG